MRASASDTMPRKGLFCGCRMATQTYLINELTARTIFVEQLAKSTVDDAIAGLPALLQEIKRRLEDAPSDRLFVIASQIEALLNDSLTLVGEQVQLQLAEFADVESAWTQKILTTATTLDTVAAPTELVLASYSNRPARLVTGTRVIEQTPAQLLQTLAGDAGTRARNAISDPQLAARIRGAQLSGVPAKQLARELEGVIAATRRDIEATAITLYQHTGTQARQAVYESNADIIEGYRRVVTLDSRTSFTCKGWNPNELLQPGTFRVPPYHYRCRTQLVPVIIESLRLDIPGRKKAAEGGPVDAQMQYSGWLKTQGKERQDQILGPTRAKAWRSGALTLDKFTSDDGVKLTLDQLRGRYPAAFPAAA